MVTLTERVGDLEMKVDGVQKKVTAMRGEVQTMKRNIANMLEQFAGMSARWEEQGEERKGKRNEEEEEPLPDARGRTEKVSEGYWKREAREQGRMETPSVELVPGGSAVTGGAPSLPSEMMEDRPMVLVKAAETFVEATSEMGDGSKGKPTLEMGDTRGSGIEIEGRSEWRCLPAKGLRTADPAASREGILPRLRAPLTVHVDWEAASSLSSVPQTIHMALFDNRGAFASTDHHERVGASSKQGTMVEGQQVSRKHGPSLHSVEEPTGIGPTILNKNGPNLQSIEEVITWRAVKKLQLSHTVIGGDAMDEEEKSRTGAEAGDLRSAIFGLHMFDPDEMNDKQLEQLKVSELNNIAEKVIALWNKQQPDGDDRKFKVDPRYRVDGHDLAKEDPTSVAKEDLIKDAWRMGSMTKQILKNSGLSRGSDRLGGCKKTAGELYCQLLLRFPELHLEDKVKVWEGSIDRPQSVGLIVVEETGGLQPCD